MATGTTTAPSSPSRRLPAPLLPVIDRPFVQHVVESLVEQGMAEVDFVLHEAPERFESLLGDGARWGARFRYHLARDPGLPYRVFGILRFEPEEEPFLLGHADRLPGILLASARPEGPGGSPVLIDVASKGGGQGNPEEWTGWAWIPPGTLSRLPADPDRAALESSLRSLAGRTATASESLTLRDERDLVVACRQVLSGRFPGLMVSGNQAEPGIWLSRNVSLHPTARLAPPVFVGEKCRIGPGVRIGPEAFIGENCVLDAGCTVARSVVLPGSYVGEALELDQAVVDRNRLHNLRLGATVSVADDFLLGSIADAQVRRWAGGVLARLAAILALACLWPVLLLTALALRLFRRGPVVFRKEALRLPAAQDERLWRTVRLWGFRDPLVPAGSDGPQCLFLDLLPALVSVAGGGLRFVGVPPRAPDEVRALGPDWKNLYLGAKAGLITEAGVRHGPGATDDERYSAEAYYSVSAGLRHDAGLLLAYLGRALRTPSSRSRTRGSD